MDTDLLLEKLAISGPIQSNHGFWLATVLLELNTMDNLNQQLHVTIAFWQTTQYGDVTISGLVESVKFKDTLKVHQHALIT